MKSKRTLTEIREKYSKHKKLVEKSGEKLIYDYESNEILFENGIFKKAKPTMKRKILFSHIIITTIIITLISIFDFSDNAYLIIYFFSLFLYSISGYLSTEKKSSWYNYFMVSFIGIIIWLFCYISSPNDLNYKGHEGGAWFFYQFYIMVSSPLNFIDTIQNYLNGDRERQLFGDLIILIFFSIFQYIGGLIKINRITKNT